ncbi:nucleotide disphospho-sugar-binding domain-containing protein [Streptomyces sp. NPDC048663]|uniref:glycosyltransferase n=1 Tax=Streptomyces sp. NPDC048663 TaxID=3155638 RepID=UPI00341F2796
MLPLAIAARAAGHELVFLSNTETAPLLRPLPVLTAGPTLDAQVAETQQRTGLHPAQPGPAAVELFAGARVDLTYDDALREATAFRPELIVCEPFDYVAPMIAFALDVPWVVLGISGNMPSELMSALRGRWQKQLDRYSLRATKRLAYLDPYPAFLRQEGEEPEPDAIVIRPIAFDREVDTFEIPKFRDESRPRALMTFGTSVLEPEAEEATAHSLADSGFNVIVAGSHTPEHSTGHVHHADFVPLARVLPWADVLVSAGGTGTVLAALATGTPMVVRPFHADQPWNAKRLSRAGLAETISDFSDSGPVAAKIVVTPFYREAAALAAREVSMMTPVSEIVPMLEAEVLGHLGERV